MDRFIIDDRNEDGLGYEVRVYPTRADYLRACHRRQGDEEESRHRSTNATTFNERVIWIYGDLPETDGPLCGAIYLYAEMIDAEIVSHEALHAAINLYRRRHDGKADLGYEVDKQEEEVCGSAGKIAQQISDELWKLGAWTNPKWPKGGS